MARLSVVLLPLAFALVVAETAYYVPKAFYTIDKFGHQSTPVQLLGGARFRRSPLAAPGVVAASSSSSSSVNGFGQAQTFSVSSGNGYGNSFVSSGAAAYQPGYVNSYNQPESFHAVPVVFNRFGDDGALTGVGVAGTSTGGNGVFSSSSAVQNPNGGVYYSTQTGQF